MQVLILYALLLLLFDIAACPISCILVDARPNVIPGCDTACRILFSRCFSE